MGRRKSIERILVISTTEHIDVNKARTAEELKDGYDCIEVWVVTPKTVSEAARKYHQDVYCYTFDELIEENVSFDSYFTWLDEYLKRKKIIENAIDLNCEIREIHDTNKTIIAKSTHDLNNYTDSWLEHNNKDHLSILGDFGTGKTWFSLNYAWKMKQKYNEAKQKGLPRPRIPIVVFLRDYAKAVDVEALISDFFFRKHQIDLKGAFSAFNFLNKHGKLLIIFDGFDEMSDKINKQKMIDNFWELASVIEGKAKVILTCRNEHFPEIKEGRAVLKAELKDSTKHLTGITPQFETVYLELLKEDQIKQILEKHLDKERVEKLLKNQSILELLKRPIMLDLIFESINNISNFENIDLATIYFYATKNKLTRDILEERTFTSLADKYFFMCEISQEMLHNNKLSISYKEFPDLIREYFSQVVKDDEIDYWRYDMHGQTLLVIDEDGQYKPAHKSFLEFFLTYKYVAMLGLLKSEYLEVFEKRNDVDSNLPPKEYTWNTYFKLEHLSTISPLSIFTSSSVDELVETIGVELLTKPMCEIASEMIDRDQTYEIDNFFNELKGKNFEEVGYLPTNILFILLTKNPKYCVGKDFSNLCLRNLDLNIPLKSFEYQEEGVQELIFQDTNFNGADLRGSNFNLISSHIKNYNKYKGANFDGAYIDDNFFRGSQIDDICLIEEKNQVIVGAFDELLLLDIEELKVIKRISTSAWHVFYLEKKKLVFVSDWFKVKIYDTNLNHLQTLEVTKTTNDLIDMDEDNGWIGNFCYSEEEDELLITAANSTLYRINLKTFKEKEYDFLPHTFEKTLKNESDGILFQWGFRKIYFYDTKSKTTVFEEDSDKFGRVNLETYSWENLYFVANNSNLELRKVSDHVRLFEIDFEEEICFIEFNESNNLLYCFLERKLILIEVVENTLVKRQEILIDFEKVIVNYEPKSFVGIDNKIEKVLFVDKDRLLILLRNTVIYYSLLENKILNYFQKFENLLETSFRNCEGINEVTRQLIYQNGGNINN